MSTPVSIQDGPFTTNTLVSIKFVLIHILIIWGSILPILIEIYLFWKIVEENFILFYFLLPFQFCICFLILVISSTLLSKLLLLVIKFIHKPKEGVGIIIVQDINQKKVFSKGTKKTEITIFGV